MTSIAPRALPIVNFPATRFRTMYRSALLDRQAMYLGLHVGTMDERRRASFFGQSPACRAFDRAAAWREVEREFAVLLANAVIEDRDEWSLAYAINGFKTAGARHQHWADRAGRLHDAEMAAR